MTSIVQRAPARPIPRLRPRRGLLSTLRRALGAAACRMLRPAAGRVLDPRALSDQMRRDLGFDRS
ncbi:hypothetical protein [Inquilinus limosus]|uniref:hypothetical protein n=1 Tax=Inquilinus limosus TaxID=171674 RepID=UPI000479CF17|nr:hypothetical protein [Inquilinus limosus]